MSCSRRWSIIPFFLLCSLSLFIITISTGACGGEGNPVDPGDDEENPSTPDADSASVTVGSSGGEVLLPDGSGVVFPSGALSSSVPVTVVREDASAYFDSSGDGPGRVLLSTTAPVSTFSEEVEIRVRLPSQATPADSSKVLAGVVDEESGAVTVETSSIEMVEGEPFLVVRADHFSVRLFEWLFGEDPPSQAQLSIPYYNQGASPYCWAASVHMVTQAADFGEVRLLTDIIGKAGIDEGGISAVEFRTSSAISDLVKRRTGVRPDRYIWDIVNKNQMRDYLWREIGVNDHPVAVFSSKLEHAVVLTGYDVSEFVVHDPASTRSGQIGYTKKDWNEFIDGMALNDKLVTLVVPDALEGDSDLLAINFLPQAVQFLRPGEDGGAPSSLWRFGWDYTRPEGYSFRHSTSGDLGDPLPGEVTTLQAAGDIEITNASRTASRDVSVWLDVTAMGAPSGVGRLSTQRDVTVGPNSRVALDVPDIKVDTFRYNTDEPTEYLLTVTAFIESSKVDRQTLIFDIDPVEPELASVTPNPAAVGETVTISGKKLGLLPMANEIDFNGETADEEDITSWKDDEIRVKVPDGAASGPLVVKRGEVESNSLDFTVAEYVTVSGTVARTYGDDFIEGTMVEADGSWALRAEEAELDFLEPETQYHSFYVKLGKPAELSLAFNGTISPGSIATDDGGRLEFKPFEWEFSPSPSGSSFSWSQGGSESSPTFSFTFETLDDMFCVRPSFEISAQRFDSEDVLVDEDVYVNGRTTAIFCVKPAL
jgi:hypothetical protein